MNLEAATMRFDISHLVHSDSIPLFGLDERIKGIVYPMFYKLDGGFGSILLLMNQHPGHESIELKVYPHIVHTIKSFSITMEMPCSIKMMRTMLQWKNCLRKCVEFLHNIVTDSGMKCFIKPCVNC